MLEENYHNVQAQIPEKVTLVAVSKTYPAEDIQTIYHLGQRDFGENKVQELAEKQALLPKDIRWHLIGHLQTNKVKQIIPFIHLIHSVDSLKLLAKINAEAEKINRNISVLLQLKINQEATKFGLDTTELAEILQLVAKNTFPNITLKGFMGMATHTTDHSLIHQEFKELHKIYEQFQDKQQLSILSMGMSSDYEIALENKSNMLRIGSTIFGKRQYN